MLDKKSTGSAPTTSIKPKSGLIVLTGSDVDTVLSKLDLELALSSQQDVFTAFSASSSTATETFAAIQIPHRATLVTESQKTLVMPSRAGRLLGCKFVAVPKEGDGGLPGSAVVLDAETGKVKGLVNARKLTALRNACGEWSTFFFTSMLMLTL
jgi:ornithine cyclodeaminase/alanine dehydrogenase-like protein (mu-crystallin family)